MIVEDRKGFIIKMQKKIQGSTVEDAMLFGGRIQGSVLSLEEAINTQPYIVEASRDRLKFSSLFIGGSIRALSKAGKELVFLHMHPGQKNLHFSETDRKFERELLNLTVDLGYRGSVTFLVASACDIIGRSYRGGQEEEVCFLSARSNSRDVSEWEILTEEGLPKGIIYQTQTNDMIRVSQKVACQLKELQEEVLAGQADDRQQRLFEEKLKNSLPNREEAFLKPMRHSAQTQDIDRLEILVQNGCNLNCRYCYAQAGTYGKKTAVLSPEQGRQMIRALTEQGIQRIGNILFFGGEPSVYPDTVEAICEECEEQIRKQALKKMPQFEMISNGFQLSLKCLEVIRQYHICLTVSVDGPERIHNNLRKGKYEEETYSQVIKNINRLKELSVPPVMIEATYTSLHEEHGLSRKQTASILREETGIDNIYLCDCKGNEWAPKGETKEEILAKDRDQTECLFQRQEYRGEFIPLMSFVLRCAKILNKEEMEDALCGVGFRSFTVEPNGNFYPCHFFVEIPSFRLGNIFEDKSLEKGKGIAETKLRRYTKNQRENCKKCWIRNFCDRCVYQLYQIDMGELEAKTFETGCEILKNRYRQVILHLMNLTKEERRRVYQMIIAFQQKNQKSTER